MDNLAGRRDHLKPDDISSGHAILYGFAAAGVFGNVAPDEAGLQAHRIARIDQSMVFEQFVNLVGDHARLDHNHHVLFVDFDDLVHAVKIEHNPAVNGHRSAGESTARAARGHRDQFPVGQLHNLGNLLGTLGTDHHFGHAGIAVVGDLVVRELLQLSRVAVDDIPVADDLSKLGDNLRRDLVVVCLRAQVVLPSSPMRSINLGTTSNRSPTIPKSATLKICASGSLLMTTTVSAVCMPARCCMAPEMPTAT